MDEKKRKIISRTAIVGLNVIFSVAIVILSVFYARQNSSKIYNQNIRDIINVNEASSEISAELYSNLENKQSSLVEYAMKRKLSLSSFMEGVSDLYEEDNSSFQLIGKDYTGYLLEKDDDGNYPAVSYKDATYGLLKSFVNNASSETINESITLELTDQISGTRCFGRISNIAIYDTVDPTYYSLLLLYRSSSFSERINLDGGFDSLSSVLINEDGTYVLRNDNYKSDSFFNYLYVYNDLTLSELNEIKAKVNSNSGEVLKYKNSAKEDSVYVYSHVKNTQWTCISGVKVSSFHNSDPDLHYVSAFVILLCCLMVVDLVYFAGLNKQLKQAAKEANAANIAKSNFLSSMSHDIRTPMNAIVGMTTILSDEVKKENPDKGTLAYGMKTIETSGNNLITLINDILDISKIESGKVALASEPFSIAEMLNHLVDIVQRDLNDKHLEMNIHIHDVEDEFVIGDELRMSQIFMNILSNAIKYTEAHGKITVDLIEKKDPSKPNKAKYVYVVEDNGIGMSEEFLNDIFSRFSRAVDTRINKVQGSGLGMSIVKQLVDLMGGTIDIKSKLNEGSKFTVSIELPVKGIPAISDELPFKRVFVIDDDPVMLKTLSYSFAKTKTICDVFESEDGLLKFLGDNPSVHFDFALVDWKIPGTDPEKLIRLLHDKCGKDTKVIVITAYNIEDIVSKARAAGADGFINKPIYTSKLISSLSAYYSDKNGGRSLGEGIKFHLNVLVAEDNDMNWKVLNKILQKYNIQAIRAENGEEALKKVETSTDPFDIVFMDVEMPVMNGYEATEKIRALSNASLASTPIYAMSADTFAEDIAKCKDVGMDGHLAKPVDLNRLLKVLGDIETSKKLGKA